MSQPGSTAGDAAQSRKTFRILYADDMRELRELARLSLPRDGHSVECVANGREALEKLATNPSAFDLVITDHHMPEMNGLELVRVLREESVYRGKVLVFCSELSREVREAYRALAVDEVLYKPVVPAELRQVLKRI
ncbi:MAG: response regulator [Opitutae bacterium]|nr:response regulator [Opitutae bacterium]